MCYSFCKTTCFAASLVHCPTPVIERVIGSSIYYVRIHYRVIRLLRTQNFFKNYYFLPLDTLSYVCVSESKKCLFFGKLYIHTKWMTGSMSALSLSSFCFREPKDSRIFENLRNDYHKVCIYFSLRIALWELWSSKKNKCHLELAVLLFESAKSTKS